jgi:hypothetical protein
MDEALRFESIIGKPRFVVYFYSTVGPFNYVAGYYASQYKLLKISSASSTDRMYQMAEKYFYPAPFENKKVVCIVGAPGSGKTCVSKALSNDGFVHISVSGLLSKEITRGFHLKDKVKDWMHQGEVVQHVIFLL